MKDRVAYDDAVALLDADHKAVKTMFIDHATPCDDGAPAATRHRLAAHLPLSAHAIEHDKVKPSWIVSHELPLADTPGAYACFDQRGAGWTKVMLKPR